MKKFKKIGIILLFVLVIGGGVGGFYYFSVNSNLLKTDNAKVTAKMYTVTGTSATRLLEWDVAKGDFVVKNQVLGRQETLPNITSPINGTVVKSDAIAGQPAGPASQLAVIADTDDMYIGVNIEETEITKVALGQKVDVTIDAYGNHVFSGRVTEIDTATQTYFTNGLTSFSTSGDYTKVKQLIPVKVVIDNPDELPLLYGMNCEVAIHLH
ncbi:HlyD family secretion protein [Caproiciproducens galactitolivorans]|uniref:Efflux RND transporter periplasmic adaptor subunit n=1 Tax=Caproiciproducens galactitolivorans TaxID=642589 RepID=A0ABT4BRS7_9FIRM|nr:efflux RND transporter periplasmic adaptor subunit [Caproiciproducens galactitolivorans]MCY1713592.1 efflux RND transporter periplasmic adaptor subunit [Caproiciproducens galactitolivorans]